MNTSIDYTVTRSNPFSVDEFSAMQKSMAEANAAKPFESEPLDFYETDGKALTELEGSTKLASDLTIFSRR